MIKDIIIHIVGRTRRKEAFGHTSHLSRSRGGAVTRRAVARRRSRARRLDSPLGGGYPERSFSGGLVWVGVRKWGRL